jgi:hypothetical protein
MTDFGGKKRAQRILLASSFSSSFSSSLASQAATFTHGGNLINTDGAKVVSAGAGN